MKLLFTMDQRDYTDHMPVRSCTTVRAIICRDGKYAMQRARAGYYKIPGGGVDRGETLMDTLAREVREEMGLLVIIPSAEAIGEVREKRRDIVDRDVIFARETLFYRCEVEDTQEEPRCTASEKRLGFVPAWATIDEILEANRQLEDSYWQMRDTLFLRWYQEHILENR